MVERIENNLRQVVRSGIDHFVNMVITPDAIYQHLGRKYMSMNLDLDMKLCNVEPADADYYTEAIWEGRLKGK